MTYTINKFFWLYIVLLITFNDLLGLFIVKVWLRYIYMTAIILWILMRFNVNKGVLFLPKEQTFIAVYLSYSCLRFFLQVTIGTTSTATYITFAQFVIPILGYYMAKQIDEKDCTRIEALFCLCTAVSVVLGIVDGIIHFIPSTAGFARDDLYAYIANGELVSRGYTMAGSALSTGFICALSMSFLCGSGNKLFKSKKIKHIILIVSFLGLLRSYSRGAFAFFLVTFCTYTYMYTRNKRFHLNKRIFFSILAGLMCVFLILLLNWDSVIHNAFFERFISVGLTLQESSNAKRLQYQVHALSQIFKKFFWVLGYGFGFTGYQATRLRVLGAINSESYILSIAINIGIVGLLMFVMIFLDVVLRNNRLRYMDWRYLSIVLGMLAWSVMYIVLDSDLNALLFWYCVGRTNLNKIVSYKV